MNSIATRRLNCVISHIAQKPKPIFGLASSRCSASTKKVVTRKDYNHFAKIQTRWEDNDVYGHVNNVVYYSFFDSIINTYLIQKGGLSIHNDEVIGVAVETGCQFRKSVAYPDELEGGLAISKLGNSSVRYEIGIFQKNSDEAAAFGHFVHVFVDRKTNQPVPIPSKLRKVMEEIQRKQ